MLLNIMICPVMAEGLLTGNYTFIDTCYSPDLEMYAAVAKDLTNTNTPAKIFVSTNGEEWTVSKSFDIGLHSANKENHQTIVWWEAEQKFVVSMNNKLYTSTDGKTWSVVQNDEFNKSNKTVETNGTLLVLSTGSSVRIAENLVDNPLVYTIDSNAYGKTVGVTDTEPYRIAITDMWKTWQKDMDGTANALSVKLGAHPTDMAYVNSFDGWIVIDNTNVLKVLAKDTVKYTNFSVMKLSDGYTNTDKFTAAAADKTNIAVGTDVGRIYVAPNVPEALTIDVQWQIAQPGNGEANTEEVRSITTVDENTLLAATKTKLFMVMNTEDGWKYYDTSKSEIKLENTRIEVPESGTKSVMLEPVNYDYRGELSSDEVVSFEAVTALPSGITADFMETSAELTIDSSVEGGHELVWRAKTAKGKTTDFTVTIVNEVGVEIHGLDKIAVPRAGEPNEECEYRAVVMGTDGTEMDRKANLRMVEMPKGISFDAETGIFTITSEAQEGDIVLEAYSNTNPDTKIIKTVRVSLRRPTVATITGGKSEIYIPDSEKLEEMYTATLFDQTEREMPGEPLIWSIAAKDIEDISNISIDSESGKLSITNSAVKGTITVRAAAVADETVYDEKDVTLLYTDLRKAKEDAAAVKLDTETPVTEKMTLPLKGAFGSDLIWSSADEKLIKSDGTVTRPYREDKKVKLTVVASMNGKRVDKSFEITVKKADTIVKNGDFSSGTTDGWRAEDGTTLAIIQEDGANAMSVTGSGAYIMQVMTNDSSFAFELTAKAPVGSELKIISKENGEIASMTSTGGRDVLKGTVDYRREKDTFEDMITVRSGSGEMVVYELKIYEITLELSKISEAVNKAAYSGSAADIENAKALLAEFYDLPVRKELEDKLSSIKPAATPRPGGGGSSGGGGGGGTAPSNAGSNINNIPAPQKPADNYADQLDTYLLNFKDMKNHWAREDVEYMGTLKLISGDGNGSFNPDSSITRAEFAALVTRVMGLEETQYENSFFDVVEDDWYSGYVQTVRSNDFMNGYDGLFNPNKAISREEIAKVIVAAYNSKTGTELEKGRSLYFNDLEDISYWAYDYIAEAQELGFITGVTQELFAPKNPATRAQAAVMLRRVYDKLNPAE